MVALRLPQLLNMSTEDGSDDGSELESDYADYLLQQEEEEQEEHRGRRSLNGYGVGVGAMAGVIHDDDNDDDGNVEDMSQGTADLLAIEEAAKWLMNTSPPSVSRTERRLNRAAQGLARGW